MTFSCFIIFLYYHFNVCCIFSNVPSFSEIDKISIQQDYKNINLYAFNNIASKYIQKIWIILKGKIKYTIIVGDFDMPISVIDFYLFTDKRICKDVADLNTINQYDLTDIPRSLHPTTVDYTFFSSACGTLTKIDPILGHKANCNKLQRIEIIHYMFSSYC